MGVTCGQVLVKCGYMLRICTTGGSNVNCMLVPSHFRRVRITITAWEERAAFYFCQGSHLEHVVCDPVITISVLS